MAQLFDGRPWYLDVPVGRGLWLPALRWKGWRIRDFFVVQHSGGGNVSSENWDVFGVFLMQVLVQFFESS